MLHVLRFHGMWSLLCVMFLLVKASFLRLLLRRASSSHATELRELKDTVPSTSLRRQGIWNHNIGNYFGPYVMANSKNESKGR